MALYDYTGALRQGRKQYQASVAKGEYPYLPVLDDILANADIVSEVNLGLIDVPLSKIVGTKTKGRTEAFAGNFMPLLGEKTEFGAKWARVYDYQIEEGIHDPILAYEFMNRYYVQEGNKRVSVLKYVNAYSVPAYVTRLLPRRSKEADNRLYYAFLDFYQVSFNCDVWFSREESYSCLLKAMGMKPGQVWDQDQRMYFKGAHDLFVQIFEGKRTPDIEMTASDAFLVYVEIFGYSQVKEKTGDQMRRDLDKIWDELLLKAHGNRIDLVENPAEQEKPAAKLLDWLEGSENIEPEMLKIAFIYPKTKESSGWVYAHELGRMYLEQKYEGKLQTVVFNNASTDSQVAQNISLAVASGCNVIFTTSPQMAAQSVKAAVENPQIRVFNCSVNVSYSSICTYYARTYEAKFLMGALAAAMCDGDELGYIADYPIYGRVSNINAFALGARMINPRARVRLTWSGLENDRSRGELEEAGITWISGDDMITPKRASREFGLYHCLPDGTVENLATPICDWGKCYVQLVEMICRGMQDAERQKGKMAVNYWWGMSADVIDVICSDALPRYTKHLIRFLKSSICGGRFQIFEGEFETQSGEIIGEEGRSLTPEEIVKMDWLAANIVGPIQPVEAFKPEARPMILLQGVRTDAKDENGEDEKGENSGTGGS